MRRSWSLWSSFILTLCVAAPAKGDFYLYSTTSVYRPPSSTSGIGFGVARSGPLPDTARTQDGSAFGSGVTIDKKFYLTFSNTLVLDRRPSFAESELGGTALAAGTELALTIYKTPTDRINYIVVSGDLAGPVEYAHYAGSDYIINLKIRVGNPVASRSGDAAAAFGLMIDGSDDPLRDYKGAVFVTDVHPLDVDAALSPRKDTALVSLFGSAQVLGSLAGYLPESLLSKLGINPAIDAEVRTKLAGYSGTQPLVSNFSNSGLFSSDDFHFETALGVPSNLVKLSLTNSSWPANNIGFGLADATAPTLKLLVPKRITVGELATTISVQATDDASGIGSVFYTVDNGEARTATLKKGVWTFKTKKLKKGQKLQYTIQATDVAGNLSEPKVVTLVRPRR